MCLCSSWAQDPFSMMLRVAKARAEVGGWWAASKTTLGRLFLYWYFEGHLALCKVFLWAGHLVSRRPVKSPRTSTPKPPVLPTSCSTKTLYLCLCALTLCFFLFLCYRWPPFVLYSFFLSLVLCLSQTLNTELSMVCSCHCSVTWTNPSLLNSNFLLQLPPGGLMSDLITPVYHHQHHN